MGLSASGAKLDMTLSENRLPGEVHNLQPKAYNATGTTTYRLEPNNQLYEGVRYVFINVTASGSAPWALNNLRRVCQVVPTNYEGSFHSSDDTLNRIWWTGAYTARVTMVGNGLHSTNAGYLGSELKDRGDRIAFLGATRGRCRRRSRCFCGTFAAVWFDHSSYTDSDRHALLQAMPTRRSRQC